jgi:1-acyl-sn-glycerol-3-phosphate acyltransferase
MLKALADWGLKVTGWTVQPMEGVPDKCVVVCYPHTSNWDLMVLQAVAFHFGIHLNWLGKKQIFSFGLGPLMRRLGGIPVDRSAPQGLVKQVAAEFDSARTLRLCIPPEGTRSHVEYWKSGFYRIALEAGVPLQIAEVNYATRTVGFGVTIHPSGDVKEDMDRIRAALAGNRGRYPELEGKPRLKDEDAADAAPPRSGA